MTESFQERHATRLRWLFRQEECNLDFVEEMKLYAGKSIDLGTLDFKYGIEIKSCLTDLKSGYGLNQQNFGYGYVVAPFEIACQTIGYLYLKGMSRTGYIAIVDDNKYILVKPAEINPALTNKFESIFEIMTGDSDVISKVFRKYNLIYNS